MNPADWLNAASSLQSSVHARGAARRVVSNSQFAVRNRFHVRARSMRSFAVPFLLMLFVFTAAEDSTKRVLASKCCPDGFALDEDEWECVEALTDAADVTTVVSRESITDVTETGFVGNYSILTYFSQNSSETDVTDGGLETYTMKSEDISYIEDTTSNSLVNSDNVNKSADSMIEIDKRNYLRKEESLTDLFERHPEGVPWLPPALHNTSRSAWSSLVVRYGSLRSLTCFQRNGTRIKGSQTDRYRLMDNGTFVLLSPTTRNRSSQTIFSPSEYCVDVTNVTKEVVFIVCPCRRVHCVSKCCQENEALVCNELWENCDCTEIVGKVWDPFEYERAIIPNEITYEMLGGNWPICGEEKDLYLYYPPVPHHNSRFWVGYPRGRSYVEERVCADRVLAGTSPNQYHAMARCVPTVFFDSNEHKKELYYIPQAPAAVLLAVALAASVFLPAPAESAFGWAHGAALSCHAAALLVANATRAALLFVFIGDFCPHFSFLVHFCQVASSFWLNVMCINLAWGFGIRQGTRSSNKSRTKMFLLYSAYAWGCSIALTGFTIFMWFSPNVPSYILRPSLVDTRTCYGEFLDSPGKLSSFSYYYGPMGGLLIINIVLSVFIIKRMRSLKNGSECLRGNESDVHQDTSANRKSMFLYVKLLSLMGIVEIVIDFTAWGISSTFKQESYFVLVSGFVDLARALSVFILCCCNKRVLRIIQAARSCLQSRESDGATPSSSCTTVQTECEAGELIIQMTVRKNIWAY